MLTGRIIPCLDVRAGRVVKGRKFTDIEDVDDPAILAEYYNQAGADELLFYDITATNEDRKISLEFIANVADKIKIPFGVGGGVNSLEDFAHILNKGADKVSINSAALKRPELIREASREFGAKTVVLSIDVKQVGSQAWEVVIHGGKTFTGKDAIEWATEGVRLGAGELVINSIDQDGVKEGYDLELLKAITSSVDVPVIASGGAGKMEHFSQAILEAGVTGVLAASVFHYKEIAIKDLKQYLFSRGIGVAISGDYL